MRTVPGGSGPHVLRQLNTAAVLTALRTDGPLRIADLMTLTDLSRPAVTRAVEALRSDGWVDDAAELPAADGQRAGRLGRPAALVRFKAEAGHVLGVDVGPHKVFAMVADLSGTVVAEHRADTRGLDGGDVLDAILSATERVLSNVPAGTLLSAAVGTPGLVDPQTGAVTLAPSIPGWARIPIGGSLRERLACPVTVQNDVNLAVLAERWRGGAAAVDTLAFLQWGARVGAGIMINGRLHIGAAGAAGELGFLDLTSSSGPDGGAADPEGMGPFERQVGASAIIDLAIAEATRANDSELLAMMRAAQPEDHAAALFEAARDGSALADRIIDRICARMADGLAALHLILDPDLIVIGGGLSRAGEQLLTTVEEHLRRRTLVPPRLAMSALGDTAVALGAVRSALDDVDDRVLRPAR